MDSIILDREVLDIMYILDSIDIGWYFIDSINMLDSVVYMDSINMDIIIYGQY